MRRITTLAIGLTLAATTALSACGDDSSKSGDSTASYCDRIKAYKDAGDSFDSVLAGNEVPKAADVEKAYTTMQSMVHDLQDGAPAEIKADVDTMAATMDSIVVLFAKYDWDLMALSTSPDMASLQEQLDGEEMQAVSDRLSAYSETTCGIPSES